MLFLLFFTACSEEKQPGEEVTTGNKGPGKTEFTMWAADYRFKVAGNAGGNTFSSETTHVLSIVFEHAVWDDLIRGGICSDEASCRAMGPMDSLVIFGRSPRPAAVCLSRCRGKFRCRS